jgi:hypothetical protein
MVSNLETNIKKIDNNYMQTSFARFLSIGGLSLTLEKKLHENYRSIYDACCGSIEFCTKSDPHLVHRHERSYGCREERK